MTVQDKLPDPSALSDDKQDLFKKKYSAEVQKDECLGIWKNTNNTF